MIDRNTCKLTRIRDRIYITDRSTGRDYERLTRMGIGAVLCLDRAEFPFDADPDALPLRVWLRHLPPGSPTPDQFEEAVAALGHLLQGNGGVVVHCHHGQGRSVAVVAALLIDREGVDPAEALTLVVSLRGSLGDVAHPLRELVLNRKHRSR